MQASALGLSSTTALIPGQVGITPVSALGVGFACQLSKRFQNVEAIRFVQRGSAGSAEALARAGRLRILINGQVQDHATAGLLRPDLLTCAVENALPEILLVCCNPDQLLSVIDALVECLELGYARTGQVDPATQMPVTILSANGIYFQRHRQMFTERLEESTLFGRLPELWPELMPHIVCRLLRGVTIQTSIRDGSGPDAIYRPGPPGLTRLAGGSREIRRLALERLCELGGWFEVEETLSPTRLEFDKAIINLVSNTLGQLQAIDAEGRFTPLTVEAINAPAQHPAIRELIGHVVNIARHLRVYGPEQDVDHIFAICMDVARQHARHMPSSLQWLALSIERNDLQPSVGPTEQWLIEPLIRYARSCNLPDSAAYFADLHRRLTDCLALAAARCQQG